MQVVQEQGDCLHSQAPVSKCVWQKHKEREEKEVSFFFSLLESFFARPRPFHLLDLPSRKKKNKKERKKDKNSPYPY